MAVEQLAIQPLEGGRASLLMVRAQPRARRSGIAGVWNGHLKVAVRAPAEDGRANAELLAVLSSACGVPASALLLLRGERARAKAVRVPCAPEELRARLASALA